jgi:carboxymethylenebutenolidase
MEVRRQVIEVPTPEGTMAVLRTQPDDPAAWPKVVMFHDGPGVRSATHAFAEKLAAEGFDVVVPDLYHRHGRLIGYEPHEREADPSLVERLRELLASLTDDGVHADLSATLAALDLGADERLGTIGFCVGARAVARTLVALPERFVVGAMWHPSFLVDDTADSPERSATQIQAPLYIGVGDDDRIQPIAVNQPFFDAVAPLAGTEIRIFTVVDHAFTWPDWPTYDQQAADVSFDRTVALFRRSLGR